MNENIKTCFHDTVKMLARRGIRHQPTHSDSGCIMLDVWYKSAYYVLQFEDDSLGFSEITREDPGFDTIPDIRYHDPAELTAKLQSVLR